MFELVIKVASVGELVPLKEWLRKNGSADFVESLEWLADADAQPELHSIAEAEAHALPKISIYRESLADLKVLTEICRLRFAHLQMDLRDLGDAGWKTSWQSDERSQSVGKFFLQLVPETTLPTVQSQRPAEGIPIILRQGGQAFGSGQHCTTRACLAAISALPDIRGQKFLDVGTGNGVLAIAACQLGAAGLASDIDGDVLNQAQQNAALNQVVVEWRLGSEVPAGSFDLVFCNVLLPELLRLIPDLASRLMPTGRLLVAGFHRIDRAQVFARAVDCGLDFEREFVDTDWLCMQFRSVFSSRPL